LSRSWVTAGIRLRKAKMGGLWLASYYEESVAAKDPTLTTSDR